LPELPEQIEMVETPEHHSTAADPVREEGA